MTLRSAATLGLMAIGAVPALALPFPKPPARVPEVTPVYAPAMAFVALDDRMPRTKLRPAVYFPDLCVYRYPVATRSPECQKFVDQALGWYYSYVWIETARSAETAILHDPDCAFAWLLLHKGLEKWRQGDANAALKKAQELMPKAPHREQLLITARLHEKGLLGVTGINERKKRAAETLDELLTIYDDDEEAWFARGALSGGYQGGPAEGVPYYKALLRLNALHPAPITNWSTSTRTPAGRPWGGRTPRGTWLRRPGSRTPCTCRPTWQCASASGTGRRTVRSGPLRCTGPTRAPRAPNPSKTTSTRTTSRR